MKKPENSNQGSLFDAASGSVDGGAWAAVSGSSLSGLPEGDVRERPVEVAAVFAARSGGTVPAGGTASANAVGGPCTCPSPGTDPGTNPRTNPGTGSEGLHGWLSLHSAEALTAEEAGAALERLDALMGWAQAQQARVVRRIEVLASREVDERGQVSEELRAGEVMSVAAAEVGALLRVPHGTALRVVSESGSLVERFPATLAGLSRGNISYSHARVLMDEAQFVPDEDSRDFEAAVLDAAEGRTAAQLGRRARTMRERRYPETVSDRHRDALENRRVWLDPARDGMACLTALMPAEQGQALFDALTRAGRAAKKAGDARTLNQLRVDLLGNAVLGRRTLDPGRGAASITDARLPGREAARPAVPGAAEGGAEGSGRSAADPVDESAGEGPLLPGVRAELMVIIDAETLLGGDERPAELSDYGPISAEAARRLIRQVHYWTGLIRDPQTGEIMAVGRRRKIPAGLARWLQARDGTCRFPGCSVNAVRAEVDHTVPWSAGGPTDHHNLEHLCPKHHRLKSQGYWKAEQPEPGVVHWRSLLGRQYVTEPQLTLQAFGAPSNHNQGEGQGAESAPEEADARSQSGWQQKLEGQAFGDDPPPF